MENKEWYQHTGPARSPYERHPYQRPYGGEMAPRPRVEENTLKEVYIQVERKTFRLALKENVRGRFVRLTESTNGRMNSIIIPSTGLHELQTVVNELVKAHDALPPAGGAPPSPSGTEGR